MTRDELTEEINRDPYVPFRLHLSNGGFVDILNPGLAWMGAGSLRVARVGRPGSDSSADYDIISLIHIVMLERLPPREP
jgi:hypothetical protein